MPVTAKKNPANNGGTLIDFWIIFGLLWKLKGNTVGSSRITPTKAAYIAGFLDGDGSISAKIAPTKTGIFGYRVKLLISFTQHTKCRRVLEYIKKCVGGGGKIADYPSKNLSEFVIAERKQVRRLLKVIRPYLILKTKQLELAWQMLEIYESGRRRKRSIINKDQFLEIVSLAEKIRALNAGTGMKTEHRYNTVVKELRKRGFL